MKKYRLKNLDCANCANKIETALKAKPIVTEIYLNFSTATLGIDTTNMAEVIQTIKAIEPEVEVVEITAPQVDSKKDQARLRSDVGVIILALVIFVAGLFFRDVLQLTPWGWAELAVFIPAYLLTGGRVLRNAWGGVIRGEVFNEHFLMTIATLGAVAVSELPEAVGVMLFYRIGTLFEDLSLQKSRRSIKALLDIRPDHANLLTHARVTAVDPETVAVGARIVVKPGERIPLDGQIIEGHSAIDTAPLTGESLPVNARPGLSVWAGAINLQGRLVIEVNRPFSESSLAKVLDLVENAALKKAKTEKFITRFAAYYTPVVVFLALGVALLPPLFLPLATFSDWIYRALILLVISCPCALVISIPLGYFGGIGGAARHGILVKGSNVLDALTRIQTVVFDKTGTLTRGQFSVQDILPQPTITTAELLKLAAALESHSNHPLAVATVRAYGSGELLPPVADVQEVPGAGILGLIGGQQVLAGTWQFLRDRHIEANDEHADRTAVFLARAGQYLGCLTFADELKPDAAAAIRHLRKMGIKHLGLLSGDRKTVVRHIADTLNLDDFQAELLPEAKIQALEKFMGRRSTDGLVAFVGDGINDAPVIARADVGLAMGGIGSAAAIESADVVIMTDHLLKIAEAIAIARQTRRIVWQNIILAMLIKLLFIGLGIFGWVTMWGAVFADVGVAIAAVFNATRVLQADYTIKINP